MLKKVLTIAGSDCSGGAGIQADLKTFSAHGVFGMSVIVSVVAENTSRVIDIQDITPDMIGKQIDAVFEDIEVDAVKVGMLSTPECMGAVAEKLRQYQPTDTGMVPMEELIRIRRITNLPIVVIGGINRENAGAFRPMGIDGLAVVSSIIGQPDIRKAAEEIKKAFYGEADDEV